MATSTTEVKFVEKIEALKILNIRQKELAVILHMSYSTLRGVRVLDRPRTALFEAEVARRKNEYGVAFLRELRMSAKVMAGQIDHLLAYLDNDSEIERANDN